MTGALQTTTYSVPDLRALPFIEGWSQFIRGGEAGTGSIVESIVPGTYLEVRDKRFRSESLILLRRSDFEKLMKGARNVLDTSIRVKRILISISKTTASIPTSFTTADAVNRIEAVHEQASVALEMAGTLPIYQTAQEFFSAEAADEPNSDMTEFPKSKAELKDGIRRKK